MKGVAVFFALVCLAVGVAAESYYISPFGDDSNEGTEQSPWATLGKAVAAANEQDEIVALTGLFAGSGNCGVTIDIPISLVGPAGSVGTFFSCPSSSGILLEASSITITGVTWTGCSTAIDARQSGGFINATDVGFTGNSYAIQTDYNDNSMPGQIEIDGLTLSCGTNSATGISTSGSKLTVKNGVITGDCDPAFYLSYSSSSSDPISVTISNVKMSSGTAFWDSYSSSSLSANVNIQDCIIENTIHSYGGAVTVAGSVNLKGSNLVFNKNQATGSSGSGAVYVTTSGSSFYCTNCTFSKNGYGYRSSSSYGGGAIRAIGGLIQLSSCLFDSNESGSSGGAIYFSGMQGVNIQTSNFVGNSAYYNGGALYCSQSSSNVFQSTLTNNTGTNDNGYYCNTGCYMFMSGTTIDGSPAQGCL